MHNRRARPTLRVLTDDLQSGWADPWPLRAIAEGRIEALHPVSELPHAVVGKAAECFGADEADDNFVGVINCARSASFLEIKIGQWRGAVWRDHETGVNWLVAAGLAKGDHLDRDDFYEVLKRAFDANDEAKYFPSEQDVKLLRVETVSRLNMQWRLEIQRLTADALDLAKDHKSARFQVRHPAAQPRHIVGTWTVEISVSNEPGLDAEDCFVSAHIEPNFIGTNLAWQMRRAVLNALCPFDQAWDRYKETYSNISEPGWWSERAAAVRQYVQRGELVEWRPGQAKHYCHRKDLASSTINGAAVRGMCGVFFVPTQDHHKLPMCPECADAHDQLPG